MRKILSILLLALVGLAPASPLLTFGAELLNRGADRSSSVPACCRKTGKHHCMMSMAELSQLTQQGPAFNSSPETCPYCPGSIAATHTDVLAASVAEARFATLVRHPTGVAQTESKQRISRNRSRQKRGPPPVNLL